MAASTTTTKISATILVLSLLLSSFTLSTACGSCHPTPKPPPSPAPAKCPKDTLKLGACADLLGLVNVVVGSPPSGSKCCALLEGLADLEAALCLCTAINANVLGINLNVPVSLSLILSSCQKTVPEGFKCASD
ncbi:hypothetical protein LWI28_016553 [Acer negundo]|uniref:Bifunctional inhibitor/plant lipid transfer protein/seed storage helical domain-containing protein n=1 Tax=Acer negundo TaxID=4023 RepID=A0AAD5J9Q0_ACENE|nr:hypothetical protein LWI28_016553 [Acer negundo]KAK4853850.1 hypothetical protein QYF36_015602 [Acer negundo]